MMRWLKLLTTALVLTAFMIAMLWESVERSSLLAALWAAMMHWTSGVLIVGLAYLMHLSLPAAWHELRPWESSGAVYQRLGVIQYKKALLASPSGPNPFFTFKGRRTPIHEFEKFTRNAEMGHLVLLFVSVGVTVVVVVRGHDKTALFLTVWNIPWNVYPVLLQRYTRSRLARSRHHGRATGGGS